MICSSTGYICYVTVCTYHTELYNGKFAVNDAIILRNWILIPSDERKMHYEMKMQLIHNKRFL